MNANGNLTARGGDTFGYDQANRLKTASVAGVSSTYAYDGDGKRSSKAVGAANTAYTYDVNASLPILLDDGVRKYVWGLGLAFAHLNENLASGLMPGFDAVIDACWRERGFGDFWGYALVAEGAAEAMFETGMHSWDVAAPLVIIEEAGGRVTDVTGARDVYAPSVVASNGHLHEELLRRLRAPG